MSEIFKIILSFFHNRNEGKMFVHPVTHDAHGLALKKKNPAKQDSPPAAGRASDILPFRRSAIRAERFLSYGNEVSYTIKKNVPWHILAPRRGCFSNHLPLRRVHILAEYFYRMETKFPIR